MRRKNTRPTSIYWLIDMRPETIAAVGPQGLPFYCGKTVSLANRLRSHRKDAAKRPHRPHSKRLAACAGHIRMQVMEVVPAEDNWGAREQWWIHTIRMLYSDTTNISGGGQGSTGWIPSEETRAKIRVALTGRKRPLEVIAKLTGRKLPPETRAKMKAANLGKTLSVKHRAKISISHIGKEVSPETRAKIGAANRGRKRTLETREKMSTAQKRREITPEARAKLSAAWLGKKRSPESRAKMGAAKRGVQKTPEHRAKLSAANLGKKLSPERIAKRTATLQRNRAAAQTGQIAT